MAEPARGPLGLGFREGQGDRQGDRIERDAPASGGGWDTTLVWFMRLVALAWLAKGVFSWASILDVIPGAKPFEAETTGRQAAILYFAVIDPVAAVGLWLTSAWGGVVWLFAATSALTLGLLTPQLLSMSAPLLGVQASIVVAYFILSWLAAREIR
ncbi:MULTISPECIES: DUF6163 family protein [Methylobacterium]|uniref:DoxX family protein n=2 Tax=Pseudomonadota TaxID=1224 RepID=A0ABQ4SYX9_9HYPH|nr:MULTISPECIES: DUF6163 family protein [Methylobacterium]PIU08080.1 MAG: hypothetical protein COT56_02595 [Methylobacterium sp. CG09_land_8_20_14_0_10_71_15]PIU15535.1 MAG: hypothetical protein COT28_03920 [Methylobacterium sp. CG08_land_8_20_14_0_20_71_15]GBU19454.1 hypothetical protein AwMethylo_36690 [Methylobacterium sp.]GJE07678.1 hypothetical protein AOPFMNJM_3008 [Methylobacterium jeotgali]